MTTNKTSEAVDRLLNADVYDSFPTEEMNAICEKYKRMEETLLTIENIYEENETAYKEAKDALSFDPLSDTLSL